MTPEDALNYKKGLFQDVFGADLKRSVNLNFVHYRHTPGPKVPDGTEMALGALYAQGVTFKASYTRLAKDASGRIKHRRGLLDKGVTDNNAIAHSLARTHMMSSADELNVVLAWDGGKTKGLSYRFGAGPGAYDKTSSGFVSVKKLIRSFVPDLNRYARNSKIENFTEVIAKAIAEDRHDGAIGAIASAYRRSGKSMDKMRPADHLQAMYEGVYDFAKANNRLDEFKQIHYNAGVTEAMPSARNINNPIDEYGIARRIKGIKPGSKGAYYSGATMGNNPSEFLSTVSSYWGKEYTQEIGTLMENLSVGGANVAFMIEDSGHIWAGQHGLPESFKPIYSEVIDTDVTEKGFRRGFALFGTPRLSKRVSQNLGSVSASRAIFAEFSRAALTKYAGLTSRNIPTAIASGHSAARTLATRVLTATKSRGQFTTGPALYSSATTYDLHDKMGFFREGIREITQAISSQGDSYAAWQKLQETTINAMGSWPEAEQMLFPLLKRGSGEATDALWDWLIPGSMTSARSKKGDYVNKKPLEIHDPGYVRRISASRRKRFNRPESAGEVRAQSIGLTPGEFRNYKSYETAVAERKLLGRSVGSRILTNVPVVVAFPGGTMDGPFSRGIERDLFGDPALRATKGGRSLFNMPGRPTRSLKLKMSHAEYKTMLTQMSGLDDITGTEWDIALQQNEMQSQYVAKGQGLRISPNAHKVLQGKQALPKGAARLKSVNFSAYGDEVTFGFAQQGRTGAIAGTVGSLRVTAIDPSDSIDPVFSVYDKVADFLGGQEMFNDISLEQKIFGHRTGLLGYGTHSVDDFFDRFQKASEELGFGTNLIEKGVDSRGRAFIIPKSFENKDNLEWLGQFDKASEIALRQAGFTSRQIEGFVATHAGEAGIDVLATGESLEGKVPHTARALVQTLMLRKDTEDISKQSNAFSKRLDYFKKWGAGLPRIMGMKPGETLDKINPMWVAEIDDFQRRSGIRFSKEFIETGIAGPRFIVDNFPMELKGIAASYAGEDAVKNMGLPVIDRQKALELFVRPDAGGLSASSEMDRSGYSGNKLKASRLFSAEARTKMLEETGEDFSQGFYVDLGHEIIGPRKGKVDNPSANQPGYGKRFAYVPPVSKRFGRAVTDAPAGLTQRIERDSMEAAVLGMISSFDNAPGERGALHATTEEYVAQVAKHEALFTKSKGLIKEDFLGSKGPDASFRHRIAPKAFTVKEALERATVRAGKMIDDEEFTVYMDTKQFQEIFGSGKTGKKRLADAMEQMKKHGSVFGKVTPYPVHGAGHPLAVKIKLQDRVKNTGTITEGRLLMGGFAVDKMNRDTDMDTIDGAIYENIDRKKAEDAFQRQKRGMQKEYETYIKNMQRDISMEGSDRSLAKYLLDVAEARKNRLQLAVNFFSFGATPSTAFTMEYPVAAFAADLASNQSSEELAKGYNAAIRNRKSLRNRFSAKGISEYRKALAFGTEDVKQSLNVMNLIHQNLTQAPIQKGGAVLDTFFKFTGAGHAIRTAINQNSNYSIAEAQAETTSRAQALLEHLDAPDVRKLKDFGLSIPEAATRIGALYGTMHHMRAKMFTDEGIKYNGNFPDVLRGATSGEGNIDKLLDLMGIPQDQRPEKSNTPISVAGEKRTGAVGNTGQKLVANLNEQMASGEPAAKPAAKVGSEAAKVVNKSKSFLSQNYKTLGIVFGAIAGARMVSDLLSSDEMDPPPLTSSRALAFRPVQLPSEPMVSRPEDSYNSPMVQPVARVMPPSYSMAVTEGRSSSVNIDSLNNSISMLPIMPDHGTFRIKDDRTYSNNWTQAQLNDTYQNSDFIHPFMGGVA